jgi:hypothetical protein
MKKNRALFRCVLFILLLLAAIELLNAQSGTTCLSVGYHSSNAWTTRDDLPDRERIPGIYLGAGHVHTMQHADLRGEVLVSTRGFLSRSVGDTYIHNLFLYLDMPLQISKTLFEKRKMKLYLSGGLTLMYKVLAINLISEIEGIRRIDSGINLAAGIRVGRLGFETGFTQGLINMDLIDGPGYNHTLSIGMNFYLNDR